MIADLVTDIVAGFIIDHAAMLLGLVVTVVVARFLAESVLADLVTSLKALLQPVLAVLGT